MKAPRKLWRTTAEERVVNRWAAMGLSHRTMELYLGAIRSADTWAKANGYTLRTIPPHAVMDLAAIVPQTWSSRRRLRSALAAYWEATGRRNPPVKAIRVPSKPQMQSRALEENVAASLERAARLRNDAPGLAVLIGLYLGLRRFEIAKLRWSDFDTELEWVTVIGKGDVTARLPVHPLLRAALLRFPRTGEWLFPGRFGGSARPVTIWEYVKRVGKEAQLGPIPTHVLRHTCLTTANEVTQDLRAVQMFARHSRPETTAGYTRVSKKRMVSVMLSLDFQHLAEEAS